MIISSAVVTQILDPVLQVASDPQVTGSWLPIAREVDNPSISSMAIHGEVLGEASTRNDDQGGGTVRVDKIFVASVSEVVPDGPLTRSMAKNQWTPSPAQKDHANHIRNHYLGDKEVWCLGRLAEMKLCTSGARLVALFWFVFGFVALPR